MNAEAQKVRAAEKAQIRSPVSFGCLNFLRDERIKTAPGKTRRGKKTVFSYADPTRRPAMRRLRSPTARINAAYCSGVVAGSMGGLSSSYASGSSRAASIIAISSAVGFLLRSMTYRTS
jgi:hypothetical protein